MMMGLMDFNRSRLQHDGGSILGALSILVARLEDPQYIYRMQIILLLVKTADHWQFSVQCRDVDGDGLDDILLVPKE